MKSALVVGIDHYQRSPLEGCVNDAQRISELLSRNEDRSPNFWTQLLISSTEHITRSTLKSNVSRLFSCVADIAVFYFAGHGIVNNLGGYLVTQDAVRYEEGVSMVEILTMANQSQSREIVVILDCCHSGAFGAVPAITSEYAHLREGISVLCASRSSEFALEQGGYGVFSSLIYEALYGGATNLLGAVTVADVYAFVDRNLPHWHQRPLFKCNVSRLTPLRSCDPTIDSSILSLLPVYFPTPDYQFTLDPSYELAAERPDEGKIKTFTVLKAYRAAGLVEPVGAEDMYFAALAFKACRLTKLGQYYWYLVPARQSR